MSTYEETNNTLGRYRSKHASDPDMYIADFCIKMPVIDFPEMTEDQCIWVNDNFTFLMECEVNVFAAQIEEEFGAVDVYTTGRSGGWLTVEFAKPVTYPQRIVLARKIGKIVQRVNDGVDRVVSREYWQDVLDQFCPSPTTTAAYILTQKGAGL